ncbi:hypothetical protein DFH08DRAFT_950145 [Mycena albidolilacea]|uniref:Uncharacterized protein n=1 Tax=Mycena albidolilacea TaxID=1033008 RepID=A0AAD7APC5_9AGAR|nr:hypothetical protein DFH08DRAFT_950145 [Mycena albidolilacea]
MHAVPLSFRHRLTAGQLSPIWTGFTSLPANGTKAHVRFPAINGAWRGLLTHLEAHCLYEHECIDILRRAVPGPRRLHTQPVLLWRRYRCSRPCAHASPHDDPACRRVDDPDQDVRMWLVLDCLTLPALRMLEILEPSITFDPLAAFVSRSQRAG